MTTLPEISAMRFGYGLHPAQRAPSGADALLKQLDGADDWALQLPIHSSADGSQFLVDLSKARKAENAGSSEAAAEVKALKQRYRALYSTAVRNILTRAVASEHGFRERLSAFWMDHFSVSSKGRRLGIFMPTMIDEAIRPHLSGSFSDMLMAVNFHPAMLIYLDQTNSVGPNSSYAKGRKKKVGLNENLARELLELHTMGVGSGYGQDDVRQLAELLTGLRVSPKGFRFNAAVAEPGAEVILGKSYGGSEESLVHIRTFLRDVSLNLQTAQHLARKLAVHFVADQPDQSMVDAMAMAYLESGGNLRQTYSAMLGHPSAWVVTKAKVKQPYDYVVSAVRAAGVTRLQMEKLKRGHLYARMIVPMRLMGQTFLQPDGPDGWPEDAEHWVTPSALAGRVQFSMQLANTLQSQVDPRDFVTQALGSGADPDVIWAAERAENKIEGLALILASPDFSRR